MRAPLCSHGEGLPVGTQRELSATTSSVSQPESKSLIARPGPGPGPGPHRLAEPSAGPLSGRLGRQSPAEGTKGSRRAGALAPGRERAPSRAESGRETRDATAHRRCPSRRGSIGPGGPQVARCMAQPRGTGHVAQVTRRRSRGSDTRGGG